MNNNELKSIKILVIITLIISLLNLYIIYKSNDVSVESNQSDAFSVEIEGISAGLKSASEEGR